MPKKKAKRKKMPDAPIRAAVGNVKGIGSQGQVTGGISFMTSNPGGNRANARISKSILKIN
jgi:hypothetical protein